MTFTRRMFIARTAALVGSYPLVGCGGGQANSQPPSSGTSTPTPTPSATSDQPPSIAGEPDEGNTLSAVAAQWMTTPSATSFQWERDGADIAGATGTSYTLSDADAGTLITVRETASFAGGLSRSLTSANTGRTFAALPQPFLIEGWDDRSTVTLNGMTSATIDTVNKAQGTGALRLRPNTTGSYAEKNTTATFSRDQINSYAYYTYVRKPYLGIAYSEMGLKVGGTTYFPSATTAGLQLTSADQWGGDFWNIVDLSDTTMPAQATVTGVRARVNGASSQVSDYNVDAVIGNAKGRPTAVLTFDDTWVEHYTTVAPMLEAVGMRATFYVDSKTVTSGNSARLSLTQCQDLYGRGHDIAVNCPGDAPLIGLASPAAAAAAMLVEHQWLVANGMPRAAEHFCYSNGAFGVAPPTPITVSSITSDGTNVIVFATPVTGVATGMAFYTPLLNSDAKVISISDDGMSVSLDTTVPAGTARARFIDESHPFYPGKLQAALKASGFKTGRITSQGGRPNLQTFFSRFGIRQDAALILPGHGWTGAGATQMTAWIDAMLKYGETGISYMHQATQAGGSINVRISDLQTLVDYMAVKRDAGLLKVLTISQLWMRDGNASVPF